MNQYTTSGKLPDFSLWTKLSNRRVPYDFTLEITARCNNNCRHCYINLPPEDKAAKQRELSLAEISSIADQAIELGSIWCLISGGEPLLRQDFQDIYLLLKKKGLLVSVFTNACLITNKHIELFKKYPPRDIEVTVYGISEETYEKVTRQKGSYTAFRRGLDMLLENGLKVRLKAMALRSNAHELPAIAEFCRKYTMDFFRFDPLLNLRHDGNPDRNKEIIQERLEPAAIASIEQADEERSSALNKSCENFIFPEARHYDCDHLFHCGAGNASFVVSFDGKFRLCAGLVHPETTYDLRTGTLAKAWNNHVIEVRETRATNPIYLERCRNCPIVNLCLWCPGNAHLETGEMDGFSDYFCAVAHARAEAIQKRSAAPD